MHQCGLTTLNIERRCHPAIAIPFHHSSSYCLHPHYSQGTRVAQVRRRPRAKSKCRATPNADHPDRKSATVVSRDTALPGGPASSTSSATPLSSPATLASRGAPLDRLELRRNRLGGHETAARCARRPLRMRLRTPPNAAPDSRRADLRRRFQAGTGREPHQPTSALRPTGLSGSLPT
jgi:hypothetical protein